MTTPSYNGFDPDEFPYCSDDYGNSLDPPCLVCRDNIRRDLVKEMLDRGCPFQQIIKFLEECVETGGA